MSLIGDALRKARQQTAPAPGPQERFQPPVPAHHGTSPGKTMAVGLILGALAAVAGGAGVWFLLARSPSAVRTNAAVEPAHIATPVSKPFEPVSQAAVHASPTKPAVSPTPGSSRARASGQEAPGSVLHRAPAGSSAAESVVLGNETPGQTGGGAPAPAAANGRQTAAVQTGSAHMRHDEHRRHPTVPKEVDAVAEAHVGREQLTLDYIVYRADNPFAQINGQEAHVGTVVGGFVVKEIQQDFVRLAGPNGEKVILRVR